MSLQSLPPGDIIFGTPWGEMLRLCANGNIYVKGRLAANDLEVVNTFKEYLTIGIVTFTRKDVTCHGCGIHYPEPKAPFCTNCGVRL